MKLRRKRRGERKEEKKGGDLNCPDKKNILSEDQRKDSWPFSWGATRGEWKGRNMSRSTERIEAG